MIYACMIIHEILKLHFCERKKSSWSLHAKVFQKLNIGITENNF